MGIYARLLGFALQHKLIIIGMTLLIFAGSFYLFNKYVTRGRIWSWGQDTYLVVYVRMPVGSEISRADTIAKEFEAMLVGHSAIDRIYTNVSSENVRIEITFPKAVPFSVQPLILKEQLTNPP